jgi:aspartate/methionine/tyrosine aminotransferase
MFSERTKWNLAANKLSEALARHRGSGKRLLDLTVSNPTDCGFDYVTETILGALHDPAALRYEPNPKGLEVARRAVAAYYADRGATISLHDIILTTSTSEAYSFAFRLLCNPGDEVLIPAPSYPLFAFLAEIQDVKLVRYPLIYDHGWQIDLHSVQQMITARTRGLIVVNPNNPTGHFVKEKELAKLNELCAARQIALIADEVFLDFALDPRSAITCAANSGALTFMDRLDVIADTYLSPSAPLQLAVPTFLQLRHGFQTQAIARVRRNLLELDRQLGPQNACTRLEVEGGWYAVLRVPAVQTDEELAIGLLETRDVYVHPGHFFDFGGDGYLVVSLIASEKDFASGISGILSAFEDGKRNIAQRR